MGLNERPRAAALHWGCNSKPQCVLQDAAVDTANVPLVALEKTNLRNIQLLGIPSEVILAFRIRKPHLFPPRREFIRSLKIHIVKNFHAYHKAREDTSADLQSSIWDMWRLHLSALAVALLFFCSSGSQLPATPGAAALNLVMFSLDTSYQ